MVSPKETSFFTDKADGVPSAGPEKDTQTDGYRRSSTKEFAVVRRRSVLTAIQNIARRRKMDTSTRGIYGQNNRILNGVAAELLASRKIFIGSRIEDPTGTSACRSTRVKFKKKSEGARQPHPCALAGVRPRRENPRTMKKMSKAASNAAAAATALTKHQCAHETCIHSSAAPPAITALRATVCVPRPLRSEKASHN
jgi:hypothetical protein